MGSPLGYKWDLVTGTDFNNVTGNGYYLFNYNGEYSNSPCIEGVLIVINASYFFIQIVIGSGGYGIYYRSKWGSSNMTSWIKIK